MPELPEVETIRIQLEQALRGLKIGKIEILSPKNFIGLPGEIIGKKVLGVERRAKIILIRLTNNKCLAVHLKLTGQLIFRQVQVSKIISQTPASKRGGKDQFPKSKLKTEKAGPFDVFKLPNKFTRVIIEFSNGSRLYFNDLRKFGWIKILQMPKSEFQTCLDLPELEKLGPEAIDEKAFSLEYFRNILAGTKKAVKLVLIDQEKIAGVGNIYANEALFAAGVLPTRPADRLKEEEIKRLREVIIRILKSAVAHQGTSDRDEAFRQISGEKGKHQDYLQIYGREKEKCLACKAEIKKIKVGGRGTFYCPRCQR